ncbi:MAG: metal ABC transporter permease, partial [Planctomycetales bacterium]|nr:metal ABC transporter permease [Planctomycetales bacterium]
MSVWLYETWVVPLANIGTQKALLGGCMIAVVCGVIGCFIILRRMAFLTDALSHSMLAGVTASYLFLRIVLGNADLHGPTLLLGAFLAGLVTVAMVGFVSRVSRVKEDSAIAMMYTGIFAVGAVLASVYREYMYIDLLHFVTGETLATRDADLWTMAVICAFVLSVVVMFFRAFQIVSFDKVMAASIGFNVLACDYLLTTCTSFVVVGAVNMVGVIQVVGLMVTPAATAYVLCDRLGRMMALAALFGVTSVVGGIYLMAWTGNFPPGASIVLVSTAQFLVVLTVAPRHGLIADWRRRAMWAPQQV